MDMVCAGDLYPLELGHDHGHGLCRRSVSCRVGSGPWTGSVSCRGGSGPRTWSVQEICILSVEVGQEYGHWL